MSDHFELSDQNERRQVWRFEGEKGPEFAMPLSGELVVYRGQAFVVDDVQVEFLPGGRQYLRLKAVSPSRRPAPVPDTPADTTDWAAERQDVLDRFAAELSKATGDGSKKRQSGEKPPWYLDPSHEAAMFSHLNKWKHGEKVDPDSGAHPLVHLAWRALAIACAESGNTPEEDEIKEQLRKL